METASMHDLGIGDCDLGPGDAISWRARDRRVDFEPANEHTKVGGRASNFGAARTVPALPETTDSVYAEGHAQERDSGRWRAISARGGSGVRLK